MVITLYDYILCGDCYKTRLLLNMLGLDYTAAKVDVHPGREDRKPAFLALNPLGRIPVLTDGELRLFDAEAILTYLALAYDPARQWLPQDPATAARVAMWLAFAGQHLAPLTAARMANLIGTETDLAPYRLPSLRAIEIVEDHLAECELMGQHWVAAPHATIADLALFPAVAMAPETGICLNASPAVWRWLGRVKHLPGFIVMPGVLPLLA